MHVLHNVLSPTPLPVVAVVLVRLSLLLSHMLSSLVQRLQVVCAWRLPFRDYFEVKSTNLLLLGVDLAVLRTAGI